MADTIDAHHHFWNYTPVEYGWIGEDMEVIRRSFLPADLKPEITRNGIDGVVSVQARQTVEETEWLLQLAHEHKFIRGVVGWVPLAHPNVATVLDRLAANKHLKAVRHVIQDEPDDRYILREDFNAGIGVLRDYGLAYDVLIFERHLPQAIEFVDRHPNQVFIVDHLAKPRVRDGADSPWREKMRELAKRAHVYCKLSGLVTEADPRRWTEEALRPYIDTVLEAFGPERVMFGSDWPVCLLASKYGQWVEIVSRAIANLSPHEQARVMGGTAVEAYRLHA
jgi:L-fucono-1,5-lactonase